MATLNCIGAPLSPMLHDAVQRVLSYFDDRTDLPDWFLEAPKFFVLSGSQAYGIATEGSDIDLLGFVLPPEYVERSLFSSYEQTTFRVPDGVDGKQIEGTLYSLRKLLQICANANPTALEVLWSPGCLVVPTHVHHGDSAYMTVTSANAYLVPDVISSAPVPLELFFFAQCRQLLAKACLTRKIRWTCGGYAVQQFRKIQSHRNWMMGETPEKPTRAAFGLPERPEHWVQAVEAAVVREKGLWSLDLSSVDPAQRVEIEERLHAIVSRYAAVGVTTDDAVYAHLGIGKEATERLLAENRYSAAVKAYEGYARWLKERNPARAALERQFGYDTKHAGHLVRLVRLGMEGLTTGTLRYDRRGVDAQEILDVRQGAWSWDHVRAFGENVDTMLKAADDASSLPKSPDHVEIDLHYTNLADTIRLAQRERRW